MEKYAPNEADKGNLVAPLGETLLRLSCLSSESHVRLQLGQTINHMMPFAHLGWLCVRHYCVTIPTPLQFLDVLLMGLPTLVC